MDDSSDDSSTEKEEVSNFDIETRKIVQSEALPKKSFDRYLLVYNTFKKWQEENAKLLSKNTNENNLIMYFNTLKEKLKPPTLWSIWSMLHITLKTKDNIDINNFLTLKNILKNNNKGYKSKKTSTLKWNQIMKFMTTADDHAYLGAKVVLVFGICGALRCAELASTKLQDVEDLGDKFLVTIQHKNEYSGQFVIGNLFYDKVKKYISLRPIGQFSDRFFIHYHNGRCTRQAIGRHKIGEIPELVASCLNLENPKRYTGHCFRRTAVTLLSESGANMQVIKQLGKWRSNIIVQGNVETSMHTSQLIYDGITHAAKNTRPKTSTITKAATVHDRAEADSNWNISKELTVNKSNPIADGIVKSVQTRADKRKILEHEPSLNSSIEEARQCVNKTTATTKLNDDIHRVYYNRRKSGHTLLTAPSPQEHGNSQELEISRDQIKELIVHSQVLIDPPSQELINAHSQVLIDASSQELINAYSHGLLNETSERNASGNMNYNNASGKQNNSRMSASNTANGTLQLNTTVWAQIKEVQSEIEETTSKLVKLHKKLAMLIKMQDNHTRISNEMPLNEGAKANVENGAASHSPTDEIIEVTIKNEVDSEESDDLNTVETVWFPELNIKNEDDSRESLDLINTEETDWLTEVRPLKSPYYPQIDDLVMYFPQGYQAYLQAVKKYQIYEVDDLTVPYMDSNLTAHQLVKVVAISYENYPPRVSHLQLQPLNEKGDSKGDSFEVSYHNVNGVVDFLIQKHLYDASLTNSWNEGDRFRSTIEDDVAFGYVESIEPYNEKFPDSLFKRYRVRFDDDTEFKLSPWELEPIDNLDNQNAMLYECRLEDWAVDDLDINKEKLMECLQEVVKLPIAKSFLHLNEEASYASYVCYPIDLSTIVARYENNFYRRIQAMKFDIEHLAKNIEDIMKNPNAANGLSKRKKDNFKYYKIIHEVLLTILEDPENTDVYDLHEHLKESQEENSDDTSVNYEPPIRLQGSLHSFSDNETTKTCKGDWINACKELLNKILKDGDSQPFRKNTHSIDLDRIKENLNKDVYISPSAFCRDMRAVFSSIRLMGTQAKVKKFKMQDDRLRKLFNSEINEIISSWKANRKFKELSEKIVSKRKSSSSNHPNGENFDTEPEKRPRRSDDEAGPSGIPNKLLDEFDNTSSENVASADIIVIR